LQATNMPKINIGKELQNSYAQNPAKSAC